MSETTLAIVWFRQDLRLADNPALDAAARAGAEVLPVYIHDTTADWQPGAASRWWLDSSLVALAESLDGMLRVFTGDPESIIPHLAATSGAQHVYWNRCVEPWRIASDTAIKKNLLESGIEVRSFNGSWLYDPAAVTKLDGTPYRVFTPFYRHVRENRTPRDVPPAPDGLRLARGPKQGETPSLPEPRFADAGHTWRPGEAGAARTLEQFIAARLERYAEARDRPDVEGVSRLSPHLHFGEVSPHQVRQAVLAASSDVEESADKFLSELAWREFSAHLLFHVPDLPTQNVQKKFDRFPWGHDDALCDLWQAGRTGYPIVDAGMRELANTGYMHNRVRMIVGSFLTKNLLQDWRVGANWFWDKLVDADLANNSASWQWVAGCGADAAPYFRIFNPVTQGMRFDPEGVYVRRYVPELAALPDKFIHRPFEAPVEMLEEAGVRLGEHYPRPVVDLAESRNRALEAYRALS